jgi:DNA-binding beta-propeller fold protein YncE
VSVPHDSWSATVAGNGKIYCAPDNEETVLKIDPDTDTVTEFGSLGATEDKYGKSILASNGKIYAVPLAADQVLKIDPGTDTATSIGDNYAILGSAKWLDVVEGDDGMIYGLPYEAGCVLKIDPNTDTTETFGTGNVPSGTNPYSRGAKIGNKVYMAPMNAETVLEINLSTNVVQERCEVGTEEDKWAFTIASEENNKIFGIPHKVTWVLRFGV